MTVFDEKEFHSLTTFFKVVVLILFFHLFQLIRTNSSPFGRFLNYSWNKSCSKLWNKRLDLIAMKPPNEWMHTMQHKSWEYGHNKSAFQTKFAVNLMVCICTIRLLQMICNIHNISNDLHAPNSGLFVKTTSRFARLKQ